MYQKLLAMRLSKEKRGYGRMAVLMKVELTEWRLLGAMRNVVVVEREERKCKLKQTFPHRKAIQWTIE